MSKFRITRGDRIAQSLITESFLSEQEKWDAFQETLDDEDGETLEEADEAPAFPRPVTDHDVNDSLDAQVDRFLGEFETSARGNVVESIDLKALARMLYEADGDEEDDEGDEDQASADLEQEMEPSPETKPEKQGIDQIDVEGFGNEVARLIENVQSLIEVKNTILRRAQKHLEKSFTPDVIEAFNETMRDDHGMVVGASKKDTEEELFGPPSGVGAGPDIGDGVAGGGGGGGTV